LNDGWNNVEITNLAAKLGLRGYFDGVLHGGDIFLAVVYH